MTKDEYWLLTEKYHGVANAAFLADSARLAAGEPVAYLIGHVPFLNTTIWLDSRPLIPRSETEYWVHLCHTVMQEAPTRPLRILDLCAGSGAIGVATLKAIPTCTVDFAELDVSHRLTIEKNLITNKIDPTRYQIYCGDLYAPLPPAARYDFILSNPPYIDQSLGRTEASVVDHEPAIALFSESQGLSHITRIIAEAPQHLNPHGELWIEHEPEHERAIQKLSTTHFAAHTQPDQYGIQRFSRLVLQ